MNDDGQTIVKLQAGGALPLLTGLLLKYGIAPLACIYLAYVCQQKDRLLEAHFQQFIPVIERNTEAIAKNAEALKTMREQIFLNHKP